MEESRRFQSTYSFKTIDNVNGIIQTGYEGATYSIIRGDPPKNNFGGAGNVKYFPYYKSKELLTNSDDSKSGRL